MSFHSVFSLFRFQVKQCVSLRTSSCKSGSKKIPKFGLLIDIDGVLVQGRRVIPKVVETFQKLKSSDGGFVVPTVFVTNSGNVLTKEKAEELSRWLNVDVPEDHVVCSHDPLRSFEDFHDQHVLVTGQGREEEIARGLGFKKVLNVESLLKVFPMLDAIDTNRRVSKPIPDDVEFSPVKAIVLFGEPVRWETYIQVLMDILLTNGDPRRIRLDYPYPHLPILACNMDLQWRFTPQIPRFGHGLFLLFLETAYKKVSGKELEYRVMVGKPSITTYKYALRRVMNQAKRLGVEDEVNTLYMIGDNINTDVFGSNLYNDHLQAGEQDVHQDETVDVKSNVKNCYSVLVKTGVSSEELYEQQMDHVHRDFLRYDEAHRKPTYTADDFSDAVNLIFELEKFD